MKRDFVKQALVAQWSKLGDQDLEKLLGWELEGHQPHIKHMLIHYKSEEVAENMSDEEVNAFLLNL